jgi:adenylate kinase
LAKGYLDRGELVPDDLTIKMVMERLAQPDTAKGVVLDGFPRTQEQAAALEVALRAQGKQIDAAVYLKIREEVLVARLSARWICPVEGATYNLVTNPPRVVGRCDLDGTELYQREDDKPETVRRRLQVYENQTAPLLDYYRRGGVLKQVDGETSLEEVHRAILQVLGGG